MMQAAHAANKVLLLEALSGRRRGKQCSAWSVRDRGSAVEQASDALHVALSHIGDEAEDVQDVQPRRWISQVDRWAVRAATFAGTLKQTELFGAAKRSRSCA